MLHNTLKRVLIAMGLSLTAYTAQAACLDNVVLVHGNAGSPSDWNATISTLKSQGYTDAQFYRPNWGSKTNPAINDHSAANTNPVKASMQAAKAASCTGRIDVIGHSMGVTLAMKAINELAYSTSVNSFIGIAGAQHGLESCGVYPFNVFTPTCGSNGLSIDSPLILSVKNKRYGSKMYSIKSYIDEVVCIGSCYVYGSHTSNIDGQNATYDFALGHFGLKDYTTYTQASLVFQ
ncbi:lipase family protein [Undibacterium sp. TS12]|uniref:lipase family protein n=1 Tax=Undibacterium sp. TS12 TaxID=2908202 RepID=UPI001F4C9EDD|nr:lipase family protein [Undibacterium sp. TS12]MCH8621548.1 lipase family protein [Undibacterium sp. TS12]